MKTLSVFLGVSIGLVIFLLVLLLNTADQKELQWYKKHYHQMLVDHEGWSWVNGLPLPVPPRPRSKQAQLFTGRMASPSEGELK